MTKHSTSENGRFYDIGAGILEFMSRYLSIKRRDVTAQEPLELYHKELSANCKNIKTTNLPFLEMNEDTKYAVIYADSVFEHVANPLEYIFKSAKLLETGRVLYFISLNENSFVKYFLTLLNKKNNYIHYLSPYVFPYHLIGFSKRSIEIAANHSGLKLIKYIRRYDYLWFHILKKAFNPLKYLASVFLFIADLFGFEANLEIIMKKVKE